MKLTKKKLESFLQSQLMTLIALDLVERNVNVSLDAMEAIQNAKAVAAAAIDKLVTDHPKMKPLVERMTKNLEKPRGEAATTAQPT